MTDIALTYTPDVGYQPDIVPAVNRVKFGGGYVQTSARGINLDGATLRMSFTNRTKAEIDGILWTIKQSIGGRIVYTLPGDTVARLWDVVRYTPPICGEGGQVWSMELELAETFEDGHTDWNPLSIDLTQPLDAGWRWVNQGSMTIAHDANGATFTAPAGISGSVKRWIQRPLPKSGSWKISSSIQILSAPGVTGAPSFAGPFIALMNSRSAKFIGTGNGPSYWYYRVAFRYQPTVEFFDDAANDPTIILSIDAQNSAVIVDSTGVPEARTNPISYPWSGIDGRPDTLLIGFDGNGGIGSDLVFRVPSVTVEVL